MQSVQQPDDRIITADRLLIRPWRLEEADRLFDIHRRREVARWLSGIPMTDRQEAVDRLERSKVELAVPSLRSMGGGRAHAGCPAGSVLLKPLPNGD